MPRKKKKEELTKEEAIGTTEKFIEGEAQAKIEMPAGWVPKTKLGRAVFEGKITNIEQVFDDGLKIAESAIVDVLIPELENDIILIGGSTGKGGGIRRTPSKRTSRMHKSGRRYKISVLVVVGNKNGYVGIGLDSGPHGRYRDVVAKATNKAKLNIISVSRGCGSWECGCLTPHSIPFSIAGKSGSVHMEFKPAPKGIGLCVSDEVKKIMRLAGIKDIWVKSRGQTRSRINLIKATFNALKKLNRFKTNEKFEQAVGLKIGKIE